MKDQPGGRISRCCSNSLRECRGVLASQRVDHWISVMSVELDHPDVGGDTEEAQAPRAIPPNGS